jgi:hypothetical protein
VGESQFVGRATAEHAHGEDGRRMLGFERFAIPADGTPTEQDLIRQANALLA